MTIEAILIAAASLSGVIALIGLGVGVRGPPFSIALSDSISSPSPSSSM